MSKIYNYNKRTENKKHCIHFRVQIHLFNQRVYSAQQATNTCLLLEKIDPKETNPALLGPYPQTVHKLPFRLEDIPYFDTTYLCDPVDRFYAGATDSDHESWDAPLQRSSTIASKITTATQMPYDQCSQTEIAGVYSEFTAINEPFSRDPNAQFNPLVKR